MLPWSPEDRVVWAKGSPWSWHRQARNPSPRNNICFFERDISSTIIMVYINMNKNTTTINSGKPHGTASLWIQVRSKLSMCFGFICWGQVAVHEVFGDRL